MSETRSTVTRPVDSVREQIAAVVWQALWDESKDGPIAGDNWPFADKLADAITAALRSKGVIL